VPVVRGLRDQLHCGVCGLPVILLQARKQGGPGGPGTPEHNGAQYSLAHVVNIKTYDRTQCMGRYSDVTVIRFITVHNDDLKLP